jgi:branched-subunit amino acid aminotransferase/4-amino-4-deoxychorismate lyase
MSTPLAYLHGRLVPYSEAVLPLHDASFIWGATVTDLCRTFRHRLFRLDDHLARFRRSCQAARVPQPIADDELARIAGELVEHNARILPLPPASEGASATHDLALVLFATPGPVGFYGGLSGGPGDGPPTLGMHTFPLPFARYVRLFQEGARLVVPSVRQLPAECVDPRIKMRSRLHWWLAEQEVHAVDPLASALLLDADDHVTETAAANFLIVQDGVVRTPPRTAVLGGISLLVVEELCGQLGIRFEERPLTLEDCLRADEAMLSCTSYCLAGVSRLNGQAIPWPGPVWQQLLDAWSRAVGIDIRTQIRVVGGA